MKFKKLLFFSGIVVFTTLACGLGGNFSTPLPTTLPVETIPPSVIPRQPRSPTSTPMLLLTPPATAATFPAWVADFSDPILATVQGQRPVFEDDFSAVCIDERNKWKVCSTPEQRTYYQSNEGNPSSLSELPLATARPTLDLQPDLQNGYSLVNNGWFFIVPDSLKNPFYAHMENETLVLNLPQGKENRDFWVYNPKFLQRNFVLQFDLQFHATQPEDAFRFQFEQGGDESFALDLTKNKTWVFRWGMGDALQSRTGSYMNSFEVIRILVIASDRYCAVYLNNAPLDYFENCRTDASGRLFPQSMTFHILAEPGHPSMLTIDNVKMWDLDQISNFP
ncbi:MAG: hypothetical protein EHM12_06600 [Dehalococcoidia bacterium]|nr:MAG: hypothetical protein EHM12_06600 [Dehalococcoidia bacterium]